MQNRPAAEFEITVSTVEGVLAEQRPDLCHLAIEKVGEGWDNMTFRLGDELAIRLPRRDVAVALIEHEQRWLPQLAPRLPIAVPAPLHVGRPGEAFGWPWSIVSWVDGDVAFGSELDDPSAEAARLGRFLAAFHQPAPPEAPENPYRGQDVRALEERVVSNLAGVSSAVPDGRSADEVLSLWRQAASADVHARGPMWVHGDLHGLNIVVNDGTIASVIDFGDVTSGDPAVDLPIGWMIFDQDARSHFRAASGADDDQWARGWAWALHFALLYLANSADHRQLRWQGQHLLASLLADHPSA